MLNFKKSFLKKKLKNVILSNKNLYFFVPFLKSNMFIQSSTLSKKHFTDIPILFSKHALRKKYKKLNFKILRKYTLEQFYYSSFVPIKIKSYSWKLKYKFLFFDLNFKLKKKFYLNRYLLDLHLIKLFSSNIFSKFFYLNNCFSKKYIYTFDNFFYFLKIIDNNISFVSFFISLFNKLLFFTCLGFKIYSFKKYKKFTIRYLTLNFLTINKFHIFKIFDLATKKFFRFNFYSKLL